MIVLRYSLGDQIRAHQGFAWSRELRGPLSAGPGQRNPSVEEAAGNCRPRAAEHLGGGSPALDAARRSRTAV